MKRSILASMKRCVVRLGKRHCWPRPAPISTSSSACVGHDSLFFMHSKVPATVLVAKDRVLGHNPVACLYTSHSYYRRLSKSKERE